MILRPEASNLRRFLLTRFHLLDFDIHMIVALLAYGLVLYVIIMLTAYPSTLCGTIQRALVLIFAYLETLCALINFSKLPILELRLIGRVERDVTPIAHMTGELTI